MHIPSRTHLRELVARLLFVTLVAAPCVSFGQAYGYREPVEPYCDEAPRPGFSGCRCATPCQGNCLRPCPEPPPAKPRDVEVPRPAPTPPAPQPALRETGYYQAGPRTGALEGASSTLGFRGGAITLPRLRLELPSLELPSFFRSSHTAKMRIAESEAPWTSTGYERVAWATDEPQQRSAEPTEPAPRARTTADDECEALKARYEQKIAELDKQILACEQMRKDLERTLSAPRSLAPVPAPVYVPPQCPPPHAMLPGQPAANASVPNTRMALPQELPAPSAEPATVPVRTSSPEATSPNQAAAPWNPTMIPAGHRYSPEETRRLPQRLPSR